MRRFFFLAIFIVFISSCGVNFPYKKQKLTYSQIDYGFNVKYLNINEKLGRIAYIDEGNHEKVILFIHGIGTNLESFHYQIDKLRKKYRVVAVDMPGYGKSSFNFNINYNVNMHAFAVKKLIDFLKLKNVTIVGHSYGTSVSIFLASDKHLDIKKVFLISPPNLQLFNRRDAAFFREHSSPIFSRIYNLDDFINKWHEKLIYKRTHQTDAYLRKLLGLLYSGEYKKVYHTRDAVMRNIMATKLNYRILDLYKKLKKPIFLICGNNDMLVPIFIPSKMMRPTPSDFFVKIKKLNPHCRLKIISSCGHMVPLEKPKLLNALISKFVDTI